MESIICLQNTLILPIHTQKTTLFYHLTPLSVKTSHKVHYRNSLLFDYVEDQRSFFRIATIIKASPANPKGSPIVAKMTANKK